MTEKVATTNKIFSQACPIPPSSSQNMLPTMRDRLQKIPILPQMPFSNPGSKSLQAVAALFLKFLKMNGSRLPALEARPPGELSSTSDCNGQSWADIFAVSVSSRFKRDGLISQGAQWRRWAEALEVPCISSLELLQHLKQLKSYIHISQAYLPFSGGSFFGGSSFV
jgi:hypothetical protein